MRAEIIHSVNFMLRKIIEIKNVLFEEGKEVEEWDIYHSFDLFVLFLFRGYFYYCDQWRDVFDSFKLS